MKNKIIIFAALVSLAYSFVYAENPTNPPTPHSVLSTCRTLLLKLSTRIDNLVTLKASGYLLAHNNPNLYGRLAFIKRPFQIEGIRDFVGQFGVVREWNTIHQVHYDKGEIDHEFLARLHQQWVGKVVFQSPNTIIIQQPNFQFKTIMLPTEEIPKVDLEYEARILARENDKVGTFTLVTNTGTYLTFEPLSL